jgi:LacI family transcriptional regulator
VPRQSAGSRIKLDVIAAAAHVSTPTVSKVLNGRPDVAPKTRRHIENVLKELGYVHRPPRPRRVGLIDLIVSDLGPWSTDVIRGAEEAALAGRTRLAVSSIPTEAAAGRWLRSLDRSRTDGVVLVRTDLTAGHRERLAELRAPVVLIDPAGGDRAETGNRAGGLAATEHLIGLGHRRIGTITGPLATPGNRQRLDGYRAALARAGLAIDPALIAEGDPGSEPAEAMLRLPDPPTAIVAAGDHAEAMLRLPDPPTAIVAAGDHQAMGVYEAARRCGRRVPGDLSVIGFDDLPAAAWMSPPLTTVRQPLAEMVALAVRMLLARDEAAYARPAGLAPELVVRSSTAPLLIRSGTASA